MRAGLRSRHCHSSLEATLRQRAARRSTISPLSLPMKLPLHLSLISFAAAVVLPLAAASGTWSHSAVLMPGFQFDAATHPNDSIVVFGSSTAWVNDHGEVLAREPLGDERQGQLDMPPAISVDPEGGLHAITRQGGSWAGGHHLLYHYRPLDGSWVEPISISEPRKRNYCVAIAGLGEMEALIAYTEAGENVWGRVIFHHTNPEGGEALGSIGGIWRSDNRVEMVRSGGWIHFASGRNDGNGAVFLLSAPIGEGLFSRLRASRREFQPPAGGQFRRGFPTLIPHGSGGVDFVMGTQEGRLYRGRSSPASPLEAGGLQLVFDDLGEWHLSIGRGAAATAADGRGVLVVGLRSSGGKTGDGSLLGRYSPDGGLSFGPEMIIAPRVVGGEGRTRIVVLARPDGAFLVLYPTPDGVRLSRFDPAS